MNLILFEAEEFDDSGVVTLSGRRAEHLIHVLQVTPGARVQIGVLNGPLGHAEVLTVTATTVTVRCQLDETPPTPPEDVLLLAMPRPKVLQRCLAHAAALGFRRIAVFRSRRVVKSHLDSHVLKAEKITEHLRLGLEQSRRTFEPELSVFRRFRPFVEDEVEALVTTENRFVADADASESLDEASIATGPLTLVIGPEGGLIPHELECFQARGFRLVQAGGHPLRVEAALNFVAGALWLSRRRSAALIGSP